MSDTQLLKKIIEHTNAQKTGDSYLGKCPGHEDDKSSLSITLSNSDRLLMRCHAGCSFENIKNALEKKGISFQKKELTFVKKKIVDEYIYTDAVGNATLGVYRYEPKTFSQHPYVKGVRQKGSVKDCEKHIYKLPEVLKAKKEDRTVFFTEGEKDVHTLNKLGLCATSILAGANGKWHDSYTQELTDCNLVIIPDNDAPGHKHAVRVANTLINKAETIKIIKLPIGEKQDVTDWVNNGGTREQLIEIVKATKFTTQEIILEPEKENKNEIKNESGKLEKATPRDYENLIKETLSNPKKCIFSNTLQHYNKQTGEFESAANNLCLIRTKAHEYELAGIKKFNRSLIEDYFYQYEYQQKAEFLLLDKLPDWDGKDRIGGLASHVILNDDHEDVTSEVFIDFVKDWMCKLWLRIFNPHVQNRILILKGAQGVGKDTWVDTLIGGLEQYVSNLLVTSNDKDMYLSLHRGAVLKISEFDKTAKKEVSVIKDLITTPDTFVRGPYERDAKKRLCRCSFIASCNVEDILRDHTGHRRYLVFDVAEIDWGYTALDLDRYQLIAQARALAANKFKASAESEAAMYQYISERTPDDPTDLLVDLWESETQKWLDSENDEYTKAEIAGRGFITATEATEILHQISLKTKYSQQYIMSILKQKGWGIKPTKIDGRTRRGYKLPNQVTPGYTPVTPFD